MSRFSVSNIGNIKKGEGTNRISFFACTGIMEVSNNKQEEQVMMLAAAVCTFTNNGLSNLGYFRIVFFAKTSYISAIAFWYL